MMSKVARIIVGTVALTISVCSILLAQEPEPKTKIEVKPKQVSGTIIALTPSFLAVATGMNEERTTALESAFKLDSQVRIIHKNSLKELKVGDTVSVSYEEKIKKFEDGKESRTTDVISITFLKPAPGDLTAQEKPQAPTESAPSPAPQDEAPLSLKGLKGR